MRKIKFFFIVTITVVNCHLSTVNVAQEIPIGTWRIHSSFNAINSVSVGTNNVYASSATGVMIFNLADNSISTITKLDGLSSTGITQVAVDQPRQQVLIAYADGNLDILREQEMINFDRLKNSTTVTGSKRINHISLNGSLAYLSTDYGVVVFDLVQLEVKETWRDLGPAGEKIKIYQSTFFNDSIFLATERGVLAGDLSNNLLDFNNWTRFNTGAFSGNIQSITTFNSKVYAAINGFGIHKYESGSWTLESFLPSLTYRNITAGISKMYVTEGANLHSVSASNVVTPVSSANIVKPVIAFEDAANKIWIGDERNGLVSDKTGSFVSYLADGPSFSKGLRVKYNVATNGMMAVSGGYSTGFSPLLNSEYLNSFSAGNWSQETAFAKQDLTDVEVSGSRIFLSSFGRGIQVVENNSILFTDELTSPNITALAVSSAGTWASNYGSAQSLKLLKTDNTWESFSFPSITASRYVTELAVDYLGHVWMILNPDQGGGILVFDKDGNKSAYLTDAPGSGGLPSRSVYSIAMDREGQVWVGTALGAAYFPDPSSVFGAGVNSVKPIFESRFLLRDEKVTAIEVDAGNRKWMGTERGAWLFNPFGEKQVYNFNAANSPLPSDKIVDMEINSQSGEIFFITDAGIVSFRSDATASDAAFHKVKIFPNPVTAEFNGLVGISGLATDAYVKITDISGKLIWQAQANGGTATWNVRDYNGRRAATGMYLVFSTSLDGTESVVGKIAVVN
ncbi:MAG TPA: two-component regulator propeller domain-containing protein [Cyclobacteriaceae bacterium]|nr:two-component regulator propeller domain-containing protein [Cyclobacteriaceae bacterium]